jgi:DNA repair protein RecO
MSHAIYQTSAFILKSKNMRESNKLLILYTERFGLIYTTTQSIRELKSKMRFHSNALSLVKIDLVRGRNIWRITGIHEQESSFQFVGTDAYSILGKSSSLLLRLCSGEEPHEKIWQNIELLFKHLQNSTLENSEVLEIIFASRLLYHLGYWDDQESFITTENPYLAEVFADVMTGKNSYIQKINQGIIDSQL